MPSVQISRTKPTSSQSKSRNETYLDISYLVSSRWSRFASTEQNAFVIHLKFCHPERGFCSGLPKRNRRRGVLRLWVTFALSDPRTPLRTVLMPFPNSFQFLTPWLKPMRQGVNTLDDDRNKQEPSPAETVSPPRRPSRSHPNEQHDGNHRGETPAQHLVPVHPHVASPRNQNSPLTSQLPANSLRAQQSLARSAFCLRQEKIGRPATCLSGFQDRCPDRASPRLPRFPPCLA